MASPILAYKYLFGWDSCPHLQGSLGSGGILDAIKDEGNKRVWNLVIYARLNGVRSQKALIFTITRSSPEVERSLLLKRRVLCLYLVTMEKVLVHISDVPHGSLVSKNYIVQCVFELTRKLHFTSSIVSCCVVSPKKLHAMKLMDNIHTDPSLWLRWLFLCTVLVCVEIGILIIFKNYFRRNLNP